MMRMIRLALLLLAGGTLLSCQTPPGQPRGDRTGAAPIAEIPYTLDYQGWITVQATVNGEGPYNFIIDSGATITTVFSNLAQTQVFAPAEREPISIIGLSGARKLPAFFIGDVNLGDEGLSDHVGVILPDWAPPNVTPQGVIGLDFLSRYTVLFDYQQRTIKLYERGALPSLPGRGWQTTRLKPLATSEESLNNILYRIDVRVRSVNVPCVIDLGASGTIFNRSAYSRFLAGVYIDGGRNTGFTTGSRINDIFDNRSRARVIQITRLKIGSATWQDKLFLVYDAKIFDELGYGGRPFCLVGADLLAERSFLFDFANETLYIGPKS